MSYSIHIVNSQCDLGAINSDSEGGYILAQAGEENSNAIVYSAFYDGDVMMYSVGVSTLSLSGEVPPRGSVQWHSQDIITYARAQYELTTYVRTSARCRSF